MNMMKPTKHNKTKRKKPSFEQPSGSPATTSERTSTRGRYGRIIRLRLPNNTPALAEEADRRVVMVMGPSGLKAISNKPGLTMLSSIGYTQAYVERKLAEGFTFHLLTFRLPKATKTSEKLAVANWKNTLSAISAAYPEIAHLIKLHAGELKRTSFSSFEEQAGFAFATIDKLGANDERFMSLSRLLASPGNACDLRRFLYHVTRLSELYNGDGRTRTEEGRPGVREYIMTNRPLTELGQYELTALSFS